MSCTSLSAPSRSCVALVDCNSFYASCERVFRPDLRGKPIVVLSNNDGCIIARSEEAKAMGVPMGASFFKIKRQLEAANVRVFSSNYALYGDLSQRVTQCLRHFATDVEVYSIDEAFLDLANQQAKEGDLYEYARKIRKAVWRWVGVPVSVGVAPNKVLAKIANHLAKKAYHGVCDLRDPARRQQVLAQTPIQEVWGIGRNWGKRLRSVGLVTALDLQQAPQKLVRRHLSVIGERLQQELNGYSCMEFEDIQPKKNIMTSRSFGKPISSYEEVEQAVCCYAGRAAEKMRAQGSRAQGVSCFIRTSPHMPNQLYYSNSLTRTFTVPTNDTALILKACRSALHSIYKGGLRYQKAGVMLLDLVRQHEAQADLFALQPDPKRDELMACLDGLNQRYGRGTIHHASEGTQGDWQMRQQYLSPHYTTRWSDLPEVGD